jgi:glyoxylase-like metal-dependent hydrolase (beta-lactamase superfamily II)
MLKRQYGVEKVDVVIPTHFHDDHVAGINLLRTVENTQHWAAESFTDILENPEHYDLPCLWYDPIPVDRRLPLETPIQWEEYTLMLYPLPGHTLYAVAIAFEVDGQKVLATGDQYQGDNGLELNYVYPNRFQPGDYRKSAELYKRVNPDLIISGHWESLRVTSEYLEQLETGGEELVRLHHELLPEIPDLGAEGFVARLSPYQATVRKGETIQFQVEIDNPFDRPSEAIIQVIVPEGWRTVSGKQEMLSIQLETSTSNSTTFKVIAPEDKTMRRARIAVDVTIDGHRFGQQAEALVTII